jgi:hypothetical protein
MIRASLLAATLGLAACAAPPLHPAPFTEAQVAVMTDHCIQSDVVPPAQAPRFCGCVAQSVASVFTPYDLAGVVDGDESYVDVKMRLFGKRCAAIAGLQP